MKYWLLAIIIIAASLWLYDDSLDTSKIRALTKQVEEAQGNVKRLKAELDKSRENLDRVVSKIEKTNGDINHIIDNIGEGIDGGINAVQRLKVINKRYDSAVIDIRDKCLGAIR